MSEKSWKMHNPHHTSDGKANRWKKRATENPEHSQIDANGMSDVTQCDVIQRRSSKSHNFHEKLLFRLVVEVRENIASHRTERKIAFGLILRFTPHVLQVRSNDCITSDRSVDELLMRSHFFTLHRRLSNVSAFQCATNALHYATKNFAFSPTPHNRKTELFCSALAFPNIDALFESNLWAASARMCAWKVMKLVS